MAGKPKMMAKKPTGLERQAVEFLRLSKPFVGAMVPTTPMFRMPRPTDVVKMFKGDLAVAGIAYHGADDRKADFHCLRHTFLFMPAASGVHPKTAQTLARHRTIE